MSRPSDTARFTRICFAIILATFSLLTVFSGTASAVGQLTARKFVLGSSAPLAVTTYEFDFTTATTATFQSIGVQICDAASGTCNAPGSWANTGSAFSSSTLSGTWTNNTSTAGSLRASATSASSTTAATAKQFIWSNVTNPTSANSTFYARITLYSDAAWTTAVDSGVAVSSTAGQITVTASVDESLTFTLASATVALGALTTATTPSGTSTMSAATNAGSGYVITVNGTTLTSGVNTITAMGTQSTNGTPAVSSQGSSQFGINLVANTTPSVGSNVSGGGTGTFGTNYGTANSYRFFTGDTVASATAATNSNTFTVSYIANVAGVTKPGSYSTVLTYIATPTF